MKIRWPERIMRPGRARGYPLVALHTEGAPSYYLVHKIIAHLFVPNPNNLPQINHLDGDKTNNNSCNLQWVTASENVAHARYVLRRGNIKLDLATATKIRADLATKSVKEIMGCYNLSHTSIIRVKNNNTWA